MCIWVKQDGVDSPQGERPRFYSRLDMHVWRCKFVKMSKRRAASCGENLNNPWPTNEKHMGLNKLKFEGCPMVYVIGGNTNDKFSHLVLQV